ncbi:MAG: aminotransferase class V-fold PLP-dependent enzyme [Alphaproteobacteria bacterium]
MTRTLPAPKSDFIGLEGKTHLAAGGEPPLLKAHRQAFERFAEDKAAGFSGYWRHWQVIDEVRARLARWTGLEPGDIALLGNASEAIMRVVSSFDWRPGDNVVAPTLDYASGRYALASLKRQGVELRLVPADGWALRTGRLLAACDARTRLVYISQVNALTGQHADMTAISAGLRDTPTALMVDASHALGAVPVRGDLADFTVSCSYKFALGIHEGILAWNRRRRPDFVPAGAGWVSATAGADPAEFHRKDDARRAEYGNVGHLGAYLLRESLDYLDSYGIDAIAAHLRRLSGLLVAGMTTLGLEVMTPAAPESRAGNAAFVRSDTRSFIRKASADGILVWGDNGRIRASVHLFTTREDIELFLDRLPGYLD